MTEKMMETPQFTPKFAEALAYAAREHNGQFRKGTTIPYISHPLAVAAIVMENGGTEEETIGALLHDVAEDQGGKEQLAQIKQLFGPEVARIVLGCSDALPERGQEKPPWKQRKENHIKHLSNATRSQLLVSAADKLHNMRAILADYREIGDNIWCRLNASKEELAWYYKSLVSVFLQSNLPARLTRELAEAVAELEKL